MYINKKRVYSYEDAYDWQFSDFNINNLYLHTFSIFTNEINYKNTDSLYSINCNTAWNVLELQYSFYWATVIVQFFDCWGIWNKIYSNAEGSLASYFWLMEPFFIISQFWDQTEKPDFLRIYLCDKIKTMENHNALPLREVIT